MSAGKRSRLPSLKAQETINTTKAAAAEGMFQDSNFMNYNLPIVWCTVELKRIDGSTKEYPVRANKLETETGEKVTQKDLYHGSNVIWKARGKPYEVCVLETHRKFSCLLILYAQLI